MRERVQAGTNFAVMISARKGLRGLFFLGVCALGASSCSPATKEAECPLVKAIEQATQYRTERIHLQIERIAGSCRVDERSIRLDLRLGYKVLFLQEPTGTVPIFVSVLDASGSRILARRVQGAKWRNVNRATTDFSQTMTMRWMRLPEIPPEDYRVYLGFALDDSALERAWERLNTFPAAPTETE